MLWGSGVWLDLRLCSSAEINNSGEFYYFRMFYLETRMFIIARAGHANQKMQ
jgi:hypothetical protein